MTAHTTRPPLPAHVTGTVSMALDTIPVEHRDAMRYLARELYAVAWSDGHITGRSEAAQDTYGRADEERKAHPVRSIAAKAVDTAADMLPIYGDAFVHLRKSDGEVTATAMDPSHVTIRVPEAGE